MPSSSEKSPPDSFDGSFVSTIRCVLSTAGAIIFTLVPLTRARLSEVSYHILSLYATYGVLLYMSARLGHSLLILSEYRQPQSQRRVHKQLLRHGEQEVKASKKLFAREADAKFEGFYH